MIELLWNAPVSEPKMAGCFESLDLAPNQNVVDFGCGCGEVLIRLFERFQIRGIGVDSSADWIAEAKQRAAVRGIGASVEFVESDAAAFHVEAASLDLAVCMGATHAFGLGSNAFRNAIERMSQLVASGGLIFVADGYMKQPASAEYRELLGDSMPDEMTHAANVKSGQDLGLVPLGAWTSSDDEWDNFEWSYQRVIERRAIANPNDQDVITRLASRRGWMDAYLKWGRDTLGYGIYLFKKPLD